MEEFKKIVESYGCPYFAEDTHKRLPHNALLRVFHNAAGVLYCAIYYKGMEVASAEEYDEAGLVSWWNTEGHYLWERK